MLLRFRKLSGWFRGIRLRTSDELKGSGFDINQISEVEFEASSFARSARPLGQ